MEHYICREVGMEISSRHELFMSVMGSWKLYEEWTKYLEPYNTAEQQLVLEKDKYIGLNV